MTEQTLPGALIALVKRNRLLLRASSLYVGERLVASAIYLGVFVILARTYAPSDYGLWSYAVGVMQFAAAFLVGAAEPIVVRELIDRPEDQGTVIGSAAGVIATTSVVAIAAPLSFLLATHGDNPAIVQIALLHALSFAVNFLLVSEHYLRARQHAGVIAIARFTSVAAGAVLKLWLAYSGAPIATLAWAIPLEVAIQLAILHGSMRLDRGSGLRWRFSRALFVRLLKACIPAMVASVVITLFFRINYLLVEALGNFREVGFYAFSFNILQLAIMVPSMAMTGLYPRLCELHARDGARFAEVIRWLYFGAAAFGYGAAAFIYLAGPWLVELVFGAKYIDAVPTLAAMFVALAALTTATVRASVINILQAQRLHFWSALIGVAVLAPTSWLLISRWGAVGAALAIVVSSVVSGTLTSFVFERMRAFAWPQVQSLLLITPFVQKRA